MHEAISKPEPEARLTKTIFIRNPVSCEVKGNIATLLKQDPSAIRSMHVTPRANVALVSRQGADVRFVYIVETGRASSTGKKPCTAFF